MNKRLLIGAVAITLLCGTSLCLFIAFRFLPTAPKSDFPHASHLPSLHLRPRRNWINDPTGLVLHNGSYHVFHQYNPNSAKWGDMHWGHFRSADLINWQEEPVALAPTQGGEDADGVFSGNAVSEILMK